MLCFLILEKAIVPLIVMNIQSKKEAVAYIGAILINDTTRSAFWYSVWTHSMNVLKITLNIVLKKRMRKALSRVSSRKTITRP